MGKQKFQCKICGALISGGHARREHCQGHHPAVAFGALDVFFPMDFKAITDEQFRELRNQATTADAPTTQETSAVKKHTAINYISCAATFNKEVREALLSGDNLFITGKAGTGKTTLLKEIVKAIASQDEVAAVLAPTGVAAKNAGGVTIHSFLRLPVTRYGPGVKLSNLYGLNADGINTIKHINTIIIDEISMVRCDLLDMVNNVLRHYRKSDEVFGGVRIIAFGDLYQLMPVVTTQDWVFLKEWYRSPYFFSSKAYEQHPFKMITLNKVYRQTDSNFLDLLNEVRHGNVSKPSLAKLEKKYRESKRLGTNHDVIRLTTHNRLARAYNDEIFGNLPGYEHVYTAEIKGFVHYVERPTNETLLLKKGARVMFVKNDTSPTHSYVNGSLGTVVKCDVDSVYVKLDSSGTVLNVTPQMWYFDEYFYNRDTHTLELRHRGSFRQIPLKLAWAITIHKSQGLTFDKVIIDAGDAFTYGQVYVALSRCRKFEGVTLATPITAEIIKTDPIVKHFMNPAKNNDELPAFSIKKKTTRKPKIPDNLHGLARLKWLAEHDFTIEEMSEATGYHNTGLVYHDLCKLIAKGELGLACRLSSAKINDITKAWEQLGLSADIHDVKRQCTTDANYGEIEMVKCHMEFLSANRLTTHSQR
jgi:hypothetical protein